MKINSKKTAQAGFSLMELLIVMVMMMIILSAVFSLDARDDHYRQRQLRNDDRRRKDFAMHRNISAAIF